MVDAFVRRLFGTTRVDPNDALPPLTVEEQESKLVDFQIRRDQLALQIRDQLTPRVEEMRMRIVETKDATLVPQMKIVDMAKMRATSRLMQLDTSIIVLLQAQLLRDSVQDMQDVHRVLRSVRAQIPDDPQATIDAFREQIEAMRATQRELDVLMRDVSEYEMAELEVNKEEGIGALTPEEAASLGLDESRPDTAVAAAPRRIQTQARERKKKPENKKPRAVAESTS